MTRYHIIKMLLVNITMQIVEITSHSYNIAEALFLWFVHFYIWMKFGKPWTLVLAACKSGEIYDIRHQSIILFLLHIRTFSVRFWRLSKLRTFRDPLSKIWICREIRTIREPWKGVHECLTGKMKWPKEYIGHLVLQVFQSTSDRFRFWRRDMTINKSEYSTSLSIPAVSETICIES